MIRLAILIIALHATWLLLVIFGAIWTCGRPFWSLAHVMALVWGIVVEVGPWPCPLTLAEIHFETLAGTAAVQASPLLQLLDNIVYPNLPGWIVAAIGVAVCIFNLSVYGGRIWRNYRRQGTAQKRLTSSRA